MDPLENYTPERLQAAATRFFEFNGSRNTPNILMETNRRLESLEKTLKESGAAADRLSRAMNRLTLAGTLIAALGLAFQIWQHLQKLN